MFYWLHQFLPRLKKESPWTTSITSVCKLRTAKGQAMTGSSAWVFVCLLEFANCWSLLELEFNTNLFLHWSAQQVTSRGRQNVHLTFHDICYEVETRLDDKPVCGKKGQKEILHSLRFVWILWKAYAFGRIAQWDFVKLCSVSFKSPSKYW